MIEAHQYAEKVLSGKIVAGRLIKLACQRFLNDLKRDDLVFDEQEANRMINFGERYCLQWEGDWEGKPVSFEPWQKFIFQQVYGWIRKTDGRRRFKEAYVQVAKKNGKSTMCSILSLFHLFADERVKTPKIFTAANNEDQAKICVNMSGQIVNASPDLYEYVSDNEVKLYTYKENIVGVNHATRRGFIKALSKETDDKKSKTAGGKQGINASLGIVDEFGMAPDRGNSGTIKTSMAARFEYLMFYITTAGYNMDGPCYRELRKLGIDVLEGTLKMDEYLPLIYELDQDDDYKIELNWPKCNPNIDVSVNREFLREQVRDASTKGGTTEVDIKTLNFNEWCESPEIWIQAEVWDTCNHGSTGFEKQECFAGLKIVSGLSLNALAFFFPGEINKVKCFFWMPEGKVLENDINFDFSQFVNDGYIATTPGNVIENELIFDKIEDIVSSYNVHSLAFPKVATYNDVLQKLVNLGIECNPISEGYQGVSTPTKAWEELVTAGKIDHFGNPVLKWMNSNCLILRKGDEVMLQQAGGKIAGISAAIYALAQYKTIEGQGLDDDMLTSW